MPSEVPPGSEGSSEDWGCTIVFVVAIVCYTAYQIVLLLHKGQQ